MARQRHEAGLAMQQLSGGAARLHKVGGGRREPENRLLLWYRAVSLNAVLYMGLPAAWRLLALVLGRRRRS